MKQLIVDFHQDEFKRRVADLACGHTRHVRHDPPWQLRPWVLTLQCRREKIGSELNCVECDKT